MAISRMALVISLTWISRIMTPSSKTLNNTDRPAATRLHTPMAPHRFDRAGIADDLMDWLGEKMKLW
jgi:hypothetical protein